MVNVEQLKSAAKVYHELGLNVVPLNFYNEKEEWKKKPLIKWADLQNRKQTIEEVETLPWSEADGFAIILGKTSSGKHLSVIDLDVKNVSEKVKREGERIFAEFPYTHMESTINGGKHKFYYSDEPVKTNSSYHNVCGIELLGDNKLCIIYPSYGYREIGTEKGPEILKDVNKFFKELMEKHGFKPHAHIVDKWFEGKDLAEPYEGIDPICMEKLLGGVSQGLRNEVAIRLASYLTNVRQLNYQKALERLQTWNEINSPPLSRDEITRTLESAIQHKYEYGCEDYILKSVCQVPCPFNRVEISDEKLWTIAQSPHFFAYMLKDLEKEVKKDLPSKCATLLTDMSAYLEEPLNSSFKGASGIGKSYNVVKASKYFPREDVMFLGGLSPKAFIHQHGVLMDANNRPILFEEKPERPKRRQFSSGDEGGQEYDEALRDYRAQLTVWNERIANSYKLITLSHVILVFLESPSEETFRMLFPILSHDVERIEYRYVENMMSKLAIIEGFPSAIFLSTGQKYMEELSTRTLTITPEGGEDKIKDANILTNVRIALPWEYGSERESTRTIRKIIRRVRDKLVDENYGVIVPFKHLYEIFSSEIVRDMRDFKHFMRLIQSLTAFYVYQRPILKKKERFYALSSIDDVITTLCIYAQIYETTRTGMDANILEFYNEKILGKSTWYLRELTEQYNNSHKKKVSSDTMGFWMRKLAIIGYINIDKDTKDKRKNVYESLISKKEEPDIVRELENRESLRLKLLKDFKEWLKNDVGKSSFFQYDSFSNLVLTDLAVIENAVEKNSFSEIPDFSRTIYLQLGALKVEKKVEEVRKEQTRTKPTSSDSVKCPTCGQDLEEPKVVGPYVICSICYEDYYRRGYDREDLLEEIERMIKVRSKNTVPSVTKSRDTLKEITEENADNSQSAKRRAIEDGARTIEEKVEKVNIKRLLARKAKLCIEKRPVWYVENLSRRSCLVTPLFCSVCTTNLVEKEGTMIPIITSHDWVFHDEMRVFHPKCFETLVARLGKDCTAEDIIKELNRLFNERMERERLELEKEFREKREDNVILRVPEDPEREDIIRFLREHMERKED